MSRWSMLLLAVCSLPSFACGNTPPAAEKTSIAPPPAAAPVEAPTRATPRIVSISPPTVVVRDGRASPGLYTVAYEIENPDLVTKAEMVVHAPGVGMVQRIPISPRDSDTVRFVLETGSDFGPKVAFRAQCPGGETEWYTLGSERLPAEADANAGVRITNVSPDHISLDRALVAGNGDINPGTGVPVTIFGPQLTADCTPAATVNGSPVELRNVFPQAKQIKALLLYRDIGNRYVSSRYLEVKLNVHGAGFGVTSIERIRFVE